MVIKSVQKVIKVGSSLAVTIPAKDVRSAGIKPGQEVEIAVKVREPDIVSDYQNFTTQYGETLKNLSDR